MLQIYETLILPAAHPRKEMHQIQILVQSAALLLLQKSCRRPTVYKMETSRIPHSAAAEVLCLCLYSDMPDLDTVQGLGKAERMALGLHMVELPDMAMGRDSGRVADLFPFGYSVIMSVHMLNRVYRQYLLVLIC